MKRYRFNELPQSFIDYMNKVWGNNEWAHPHDIGGYWLHTKKKSRIYQEILKWIYCHTY